MCGQTRQQTERGGKLDLVMQTGDTCKSLDLWVVALDLVIKWCFS